MKELRLEEMTLQQKVGFVTIGGSWRPILKDPDDLDYVLSLIRQRALGAVWVSCNAQENGHFREAIRLIREAADYPILIMTDEEAGFGDYMIGNPLSLGYLGDAKTAYAYGKAIAVESRKCGYSVVCNPLLDRVTVNYPCGAVLRQLHPKKSVSARLAAAICRGMHDGGVLNCAKHYPSMPGLPLDSHMAEVYSEASRDAIVNDALYAYKYLVQRGLLDAVMVQHMTYRSVDKEYPASLSAELNKILREEVGFNGIALTDALGMMGVVAQFGNEFPKWRAIACGYDLSLGFTPKTRDTYDAILRAAERGDLPMAELDRAVTRVLASQHKWLELSQKAKDVSLTPEEDALARGISSRCIASIADEGLSPTVSRDGHHLFVLLTNGEKDLNAPVQNDTMSVTWYEPALIAQKIRSLFPNSGIAQIDEYPRDAEDIAALCTERLQYDDVVMVTYYDYRPYYGREAFTPRVTSLFEAWQMSHAISALVHFGNPYLLEELPHIPRILSGCRSTECTLAAIEVLAGLREAEGTIPFKLRLR